MSVLDKFKGDAKREQDGVWVDLDRERAVEEDEVEKRLADPEFNGIRVARAGGHNKKFQAELEKAMREFRGSGAQRIKAVAEVTPEVFARSCVLGWQGPGLVDDRGQPLAFSKEAAVALMSIPDLYDLCSGVAANRHAFRQQQIEEDEKNS